MQWQSTPPTSGLTHCKPDGGRSGSKISFSHVSSGISDYRLDSLQNKLRFEIRGSEVCLLRRRKRSRNRQKSWTEIYLQKKKKKKSHKAMVDSKEALEVWPTCRVAPLRARTCPSPSFSIMDQSVDLVMSPGREPDLGWGGTSGAIAPSVGFSWELPCSRRFSWAELRLPSGSLPWLL